jgi:hypothetical protein
MFAGREATTLPDFFVDGHAARAPVPAFGVEARKHRATDPLDAEIQVRIQT